MTTEQLQTVLDTLLIAWEQCYDIEDSRQLSLEALDAGTIKLHWCIGYRNEKFNPNIPPQAEEWVYDSKKIKAKGSLRELITSLAWWFDHIEQMPDAEETKI